MNKTKNENINSNGNKNIINYNHCNFIIKEIENIPELEPNIFKEQPLVKINSSILKKVLGNNNYKKFVNHIKEKSNPQQTYNKFGIKELKILALIILNNLELNIDNKTKLNNIITDSKVQNNKSNIKILMDSVITDLYNKKITLL